MRIREHPGIVAFGGSALVLAILTSLLWLLTNQSRGNRLVVYGAASLRPPLEKIARQFEQETGQSVELRFGGSDAILTNLQITGQGDLFIPADESYVMVAMAKGLVDEVHSLAQMHAVLALRPGLDLLIENWADVMKANLRLAQGNPDTAAVGKLTRQHFEKLGLWGAARDRTVVFTPTVTEAAAAAQLKSADAAIIWDAVGHQYPSLRIVRLPELDRVTARVQVGLVKSSKRREDASRFAAYLTALGKGRSVLQEHGFAPPGDDLP